MAAQYSAALPGHGDVFSTVMFDSIRADTVAARVPHFATAGYADSVRFDLFAAEVSAPATRAIVSADNGAALPGSPLGSYPPGGSALVAVLVGVMIAVALSGGSLLHALKVYRSNLVSVRRRNNAIDGIGRVPFHVSALLAVLFIVFAGTALCLGLAWPGIPSLGDVGISMAVVGGYYAFQMLVYNLIGYSFSTPGGHRRWLEGFEASQAFGGILLIAPTLLMMCMPQWHAAMAVWCVAVYALSRVVFVYKGFRIFYPQLRWLVFFVLYLICLEILPPLVVVSAVRELV